MIYDVHSRVNVTQRRTNHRVRNTYNVNKRFSRQQKDGGKLLVLNIVQVFAKFVAELSGEFGEM